MVRSENTDAMDHDDPPILDRPSTSRQAAQAAAEAEAVPPANNAADVEDIMVKWGKAIKTACEAQKLLQDVMEEMSHQMRTNNGHRWKRQRRAEGIGKIGQRRAGHHCRPTRHEDYAETPLPDQYIEIGSSENSSDCSSDTGDSVVEIISYQEEAPHHMSPHYGHHRRFHHHHHHHSHHGGRDRSHSRDRDRRNSRSRSCSHSRGHSWGPSCGHFRHCWEHAMRQSHYHHHPHAYPHLHSHPHPHHHHHHPPHHGYHHHHPQHPQTNSGFYNYASNQSAGGASIRTIVDTLPLALTL